MRRKLPVATDRAKGEEQRMSSEIATHDVSHNIDARLGHTEARLAYANVSLGYVEVYRKYMELRLEDAADDVAYADDTGLAFEEVRRLYAEPYSASSGDSGLLARTDAALVKHTRPPGRDRGSTGRRTFRCGVHWSGS